MKNVTTALGAVIAILVVGGAGYYYVTRDRAPAPAPTTNTTPNTNQTPTPTPAPARQPGAPTATTGSTAFPSDTTAVVTGTVMPNGAITNYWYEYSTSPSTGSRVSSPSQLVGSGYTSIPAPSYIKGLARNTTYYFNLVAQNQFGKSVGAQYSFRTTDSNPVPVGGIPVVRTLAANGVSRTTANLNGEVTPNRVSTQYWFEYGKTPSLGNASALVAVGAGNIKLPASLSLSDLEPATTYYFRLNAQNQFGTVNGSILNFKTANPPVVTAPSANTRSAVDITSSTATLRGNVNPNNAETKYWFEYSTDSLLGSVLLNSTEQKMLASTSGTASVEADISNLLSKTTYYFRVVAQNGEGVVRGDRLTFRTR
ncbi:hypothetical protein EPO17_02315 [Patescibacteria group bacterium]|nr:MAG: hypothetical protein EPO17_02315 [Patescibacteria group bacterium]